MQLWDITPSEVSLSGHPQTNLHYMSASICPHSHTLIKHASNYELQHHCRTMLQHVCRTVKLQDMCGSSRGLITFCRGRSVCLTKAINTDPWAAINLEHSCMSHTNKPHILPNHTMWLKCGFTSLIVFLSSLIKFPLSFTAAAFNANSPPFSALAVSRCPRQSAPLPSSLPALLMKCNYQMLGGQKGSHRPGRHSVIYMCIKTLNNSSVALIFFLSYSAYAHSAHKTPSQSLVYIAF